MATERLTQQYFRLSQKVENVHKELVFCLSKNWTLCYEQISRFRHLRKMKDTLGRTQNDSLST